MKIGTRTILFGVHQFLWHPFTVWRAWRWLYGSNPTWWQFIAMFLHDVGYCGLPDLDGAMGKTHPRGGAVLSSMIVSCIARLFKLGPSYEISAYWFSLLHSRDLAYATDQEPSRLCWADKACILFDPPWFYLLRARLAGELPEFKHHAEPMIGKVADEIWLNWYRGRVRSLLLGMALRDEARADLESGRR